MHVLDAAEVERFAGQAVADFSGMMTVALCNIGDRLGLFRDLHANGPASPAELAARTGTDERYAAEWMRGLAAPGYLDHDPATGRYALSPEHAQVLAVEGGAAFLGGGYQMFGALFDPLERVARAFRDGGGAAQDAYGADWWLGLDRFTNCWFTSFLLQEWIPAMPDVRERLEAGCDYADVGCGSGRALTTLARAYPASRFVGYDVFPAQVELARAHVAAAGLAGRVRIEPADAAAGLPGRYDVVSTYDVVHDAVDPPGLLRGIRDALRPEGIYVCLDIACADRHEDNAGPLAAIFYGFSVLYCMTTSLAAGGAGLGACGLPEATARELCLAAGFSAFRRVPIENPFNNLYEARR